MISSIGTNFSHRSARRSWLVGFFLLLYPSHFLFISQSAGASWLFVKPPLLNAIPLQGKTLRKTNTLWSAAKKGRFFFGKQKAPVLPAGELFRNLQPKKLGQHFESHRNRRTKKREKEKMNRKKAPITFTL
ncbi:hypothetical protein [Pedobacter agri]|uniref:hypothetical protein n=1 Tax=Pedobacter agri TaxID=454586 RepID=UPI0029311815|nr:hypothetical protein [Pedobacter agri]